MLNTIFKIYLSLQEDDLFYLGWGEIHLKDQNSLIKINGKVDRIDNKIMKYQQNMK